MSSIGKRCATAVIATSMALAGCAGGGKIPMYKSETPVDIAHMTPYTDRGLNLALPPGWKLAPNSKPDANNIFRASFVNDQVKGSTIAFLCLPTMMSIDKMGNALRDAVKHEMPDARLTEGPYEVETPGFNPYFEGYSGTITAEGQKHPAKALIAWKLDSSIGACKYGIEGFGLERDADALMKDFIAILHTLK